MPKKNSLKEGRKISLIWPNLIPPVFTPPASSNTPFDIWQIQEATKAGAESWAGLLRLGRMLDKLR
jgi:hypothetical protein